MSSHHPLTVGLISYSVAAILSLILAISLSLRLKQLGLSIFFVIAALAQALLFFCVALLEPFALAPDELKHSRQLGLLWLSEASQFACWLLALSFSANRLCPDSQPKALKLGAVALAVCVPLLALFQFLNLNAAKNMFALLQWSSIAYSVFCFLLLEQLYRNLTHDRLLRLLCLGLGLIFIFNAFLYAHNLINLELNQSLWQVRAAISSVAVLFMIIGLLAFKDSGSSLADIRFSQPAVFYTTSLSISGFLLLLLAAGGYYVKFSNSSWGTVIFASVCSAMIISLALLFSSDKLRQKLNVFINKHLFNYKYDYRNEWLKLIRLLSLPTEHNRSGERAISAAADLFRCDGAALWIKREHFFIASDHVGAFKRSWCRDEALASEFSQTLHRGWIFAPGAIDPETIRHNEMLPEWLRSISSLWLAFPLLVDDEITGFVVLSHPRSRDRPNWEDLDLAKTVSRQLANYLARHEQSEMLARARQFEAFNKLSAFVMHDLKNLIAQQSLVVKNAEKHKDNPAFVEDAINTIKNSVERMNSLLQKLKQNELEDSKAVQLKDILHEAVRRCYKSQPVPSLGQVSDELMIKADVDALVMVFTHLIHNAQDATPNSGFIDLFCEQDDNEVKVIIDDNGEGMSQEFIRSKLFQPFESTKAGQGMGVGVFQAKEYIESLGGRIDVESSPGQGSRFTLSIPLA
ncbi:XrtA/PEP-CTERM system histidine kinase PrsK [Agaribacterium haliotis]|uniref:XrtA/PEP-CTERM system histidine kinase PrsK n=1 Tax=Agaribacterium haliotis TaxID=2013869 RepID=UPI000BB55832|nr:XrtA/PEP-CTERM system histidine kinase PrsK [Agaribacterium haliotis]